MKFLINSHEDEEITWKWTLIRSTLIRVLTANIYLILADGSLWLGLKTSPFSADLEDFLKDTFKWSLRCRTNFQTAYGLHSHRSLEVWKIFCSEWSLIYELHAAKFQPIEGKLSSQFPLLSKKSPENDLQIVLRPLGFIKFYQICKKLGSSLMIVLE